jgi:hypothetical protein
MSPYTSKNTTGPWFYTAPYKLMSAYNKDIRQTYAEGAGIFTHSQEGFRPGRGTQQATQLMQLLIEDATMFKNDIIVMQLDFSSAYNTIDQPRLQCINIHVFIICDRYFF